MSASETSHYLVLLLLLSFILASSEDEGQVGCHKDDKRVLLKIKKELPEYTSGWTSDYPCCSWSAVFCDDTTHRVNALSFQYSSGPIHIPDAIGDLTYLNQIFFHKLTNFSGPIPYSITKLKYLQYLWISYVNLTGTIPDFLGQLKSLTYLRLPFNNLTGPIPSSLSQIPKLGFLDLSRNKLTGTILAGSFASLNDSEYPYLDLSHNQLSGEIPATFKDIDFWRIDLSRNSFQGDISFLFGFNKAAYYMDFSRNMFEFNMSNLQLQQNVTHLDLNHNKIYGSIPKVTTKLESLQFLNVSYNRLCGQIPQGGELQTRFDYSAYFHNRCLCGAPLNVTCK